LRVRVETKVDETLLEPRVALSTVRLRQQSNGISELLPRDKVLSRIQSLRSVAERIAITGGAVRRFPRPSPQAESNHGSPLRPNRSSRRGL
jgi:hypothetical protein